MASLIPFYNLYVMTRITWGRGWLFIFGFLPLGNLIFAIFTMIKLAKVFGKKGGFACGLIFLSIVFLPILAFWKGRVYRSGSGEKYRSDHSQCDHWRNRYHSVGT